MSNRAAELSPNSSNPTSVCLASTAGLEATACSIVCEGEGRVTGVAAALGTAVALGATATWAGIALLALGWRGLGVIDAEATKERRGLGGAGGRRGTVATG